MSDGGPPGGKISSSQDLSCKRCCVSLEKRKRLDQSGAPDSWRMSREGGASNMTMHYGIWIDDSCSMVLKREEKLISNTRGR